MKKQKHSAEIVCRPVKDKIEIKECFQIRKKVFVEEQGLFKTTDRDEHDKQSTHIAALHKDKIIGTVRVYEGKDGIWWGGRLAVAKGFRGNAGRLLIQSAVEYVKERNAECFRAHVQLKNVPFFKALKWRPLRSVMLCHGEPHQLMEAELK